VGIGIFLDGSHRSATEAPLQKPTVRCTHIPPEAGTFLPRSLAEIGGTAPDDLDTGDTLAAGLSSQAGEPCLQNEDAMGKAENDRVDRNLTDRRWGDHQRFECRGYVGNVRGYFNSTYDANPRMAMLR
jgi:hypothetical protein